MRSAPPGTCASSVCALRRRSCDMPTWRLTEVDLAPRS
jgi:hypothetical protein